MYRIRHVVQDDHIAHVVVCSLTRLAATIDAAPGMQRAIDAVLADLDATAVWSLRTFEQGDRHAANDTAGFGGQPRTYHLPTVEPELEPTGPTVRVGDAVLRWDDDAPARRWAHPEDLPPTGPAGALHIGLGAVHLTAHADPSGRLRYRIGDDVFTGTGTWTGGGPGLSPTVLASLPDHLRLRPSKVTGGFLLALAAQEVFAVERRMPHRHEDNRAHP